MRRTFADELYQYMEHDKDIWLITFDLGFGLFDKIRDDFPDRFLNTGAAEQAGMDIAVGLALSGKKPVVYSITPFLLYRPFETIRTYINHEKLHVVMIGSGRNADYEHDGFSHFAGDDRLLFDDWKYAGSLEPHRGIFSSIDAHWPGNIEDMKALLKASLIVRIPHYINLRR